MRQMLREKLGRHPEPRAGIVGSLLLSLLRRGTRGFLAGQPKRAQRIGLETREAGGRLGDNGERVEATVGESGRLS